MNAIMNRRSVREYKVKRVEEQKIEKNLRAGMQAPSAGNQMPWEFIVVRDKEMLNRLSHMSPYSGMVKTADVAIVLIANKRLLKYPENMEHDMSACTENVLLQAVEEGLGAVWLGTTPLKERMDFVADLFHLEKHLVPFAVVPIGYPLHDVKSIDRFDALRIHYEKY